MSDKKYILNEHFHAFQGEGVHMGRAAYFVRLHGCDQACPWCDAAGTWHPKFKIERDRITGEQIANLVWLNVAQPLDAPERLAVEFVVITGGEPCLYPLADLTDAIGSRGFRLHLETAGHHAITGDFDWVTLSPKPLAAHPLPESVWRADEFKIIVDSKQSMMESMKCIAPHRKPNSVVWLHPEWSRRNDPEILGLIAETVRRPPWAIPVRAGWQLHKLYSVDQRDPNADPRIIPLGGVGTRESR